MITSNTSIPFIKSENSENKFYLSRLTSEYNEGDSITTSTAINCRKLAIAIKAGDKITINGTSLTVYADAAVDATSFFVEAITLDEALNINANIAIDEDNMFVQYQRKTEGTVAGFDIDADGMSKGGVEITGWLDSDTMEGATENNIPTAQSVKAYVDGQAGHSETLQEVTDNGNTTTNYITIGSSTSPSERLSVNGNVAVTNGGGILVGGALADSKIGKLYNVSGVLSLDGDGTRSIRLGSTTNGEVMRVDNANGNVGIGTTSPGSTLHISDASTSGVTSLSVNNRVKVRGDGVVEWGSAANYGFLSWDTNQARIGALSGSNLSIYSNGSEKIRVDTSGNLGIGTSSPSAKLEVNSGTTNVVSVFKSTDNQAWVSVQDDASGTYGALFGTDTDAGHDIVLADKSANKRLVIDGSGNVGIGTTSPSEKLEVNEGYILANGSGTSHGFELERAGYDIYQIRHLDGGLTINNATDGRKEMTFDGSGNVGIGTNSPLGLFQLDEYTVASQGGNTAHGVASIFADSGDEALYIGVKDAAYPNRGYGFKVTTSGVNSDFTIYEKGLNGDRLTIKTGGNVGIGTTSPSELLHISSGTATHAKILIDAGADADLILDKGAGSRRSHIDYKVAGTTKWYAGTADSDVVGDGDDYYVGTTVGGTNAEFFLKRSNGHVGIGTTSPASLLHVAGTVQVGVDDTGHDVKFFGATSGRYLLWDESSDLLLHRDNVKSTFGNASDLQIFHDASNSYIYHGGTGNLYIKNETNDQDVVLQCDDGSGGITAYLTLDGSQETVNVYKNLLIGTTTDSGYKLDVNGTQRVQDVLELEDVLTLNAISTPDDPADGKSSIYMDSADGNIKVKINVGGEVVTRTIASYDG